MTMDHAEALDTLADHPHIRRFRELCGDDSDPERRDGYRALVVRMATGEVPPPPPPDPLPADYADRLPPLGGCCG